MATAAVIVSGAGTTEIVPARSGSRVRVYRLTIVCATAQTVSWRSGTTPITGDMAFGANGGESSRAHQDCLFQTAYGAPLNVVTTGALGGHIEYEYVVS